MTNIPPELYALALVELMNQQNVHHFEIDTANFDPESQRGLAIEFEIHAGGKVIVTTVRCDCPDCVARVGSATS